MKYILGLDVGIASIGYSLIRLDNNNHPDKIILLNSIVFPLSEDGQGNSYEKIRGKQRRVRREIRRKKFRKHRIKSLFIKFNILNENDIAKALNNQSSIYKLRVKGLDYKLSNAELFKILYWFAGNRGYKSNSKTKLKNMIESTDKINDSNLGALIVSLNNTKDELSKSNYRTIGELYLKSPRFKNHKRNKDYDNGYIGSTYRSLILDEVKKILTFQSKLNSQISKAFIDKYLNILQSQRNFDEGPGNNSPYSGNQIEKKIGHDSFVPNRIRGSKSSYTFIYFHMLEKLNDIKIKNNISEDFSFLTKHQRDIVKNNAINNYKTNFLQIKKWLNLSNDAQFNLVNYENNSADAEKNTIFCDFTAIKEIKNCLPENKRDNITLIDKIATILSMYKSDDVRKRKLSPYLDSKTIITLLPLNYSKFGHLSIKTMQEMIPYLKKGETYDKAAFDAGYDYQKITIDDKYIDNNIINHVVKRSIKKTIKLVKAVVNKFGKPYEIHIELARELGKNKIQRKQIKDQQLKNKKRNKRISTEIKKLGLPVNGTTILKMKLCKEQKRVDFYSKNSDKIDIQKALGGDDYYEIDHIIPYSISFDDSYNNKILVSKKANQDKGNRIPMQYLKNDLKAIEWLTIHANKLKNLKKRNHLLQKEYKSENIDEWKKRHIEDTRYINKILALYLKNNIMNNKCNVITLNGAVTAKLRKVWQITKNRDAGYIHHAVDATVIACTTNAFIQKITNYNKYREIEHPNSSYDFPLPYPTFKEELQSRISENPAKEMEGKCWNNKYTNEEIKKLKPITVIKFPQKKVTGAVHKQTLNSTKRIDEGIVSQRVPINKLSVDYKHSSIKFGKKFKYNLKKDGGNKYVWKLLYKKLVQRDQVENKYNKSSDEERKNKEIQKIFPNNSLIFERNGHKNIIRKFKVDRYSTKGVMLNKGKAISDNADKSLIRIDIFYNNKRYAPVPIYKGDIFNKKLSDVVSSKSKYKEKHFLTKDDKFVFSLYKNDLIYVKFSKPKLIKNTNIKVTEFFGYYTGYDSYSGTLTITSTNNYSSINYQTSLLKLIKKYQIDYFGNYHLVHEKKRQKFNLKNKK